ncbi:hypothetical protein BU24DRAFT_181385 [Aaosphaeria arxii CBS 175.79]|uniref:Transcription factor hoxa13 n=1 Tax=Aaosphaeria arxii CBS 175.79 TaxID=1450172 RepID=A0A6A5XS65_9PLEO|nr:uncharacterized protein BU24DRAFT_181385 [Aaosphaeria arxii CBS 175.79]KAF2015601.1 hypothetical protein BU24DRAFT_181385 [Aaosphaeria arxii CBS 175.79]
MAVQNGRAKRPKKTTSNGHLNGSANGHIDNSISLTSPKAKSRNSFFGSLINFAARIATWYIIVTFAFRCPPSISKLSSESPRICEPYLYGRAYVTPYLDPYYQQYVAPQVEKIQPYVDRFDAQVYTPVASFTKDQYAKHGAHRVAQSQKYLEAEWDKTVRPQLENVQAQANAQYQQYLGPHVKQASDVVVPYLQQGRESCLEIYHLTILPAYEAALPYARQGYVHGNRIVAHVIFPYVRAGKDYTYAFLARTVWPQLRVLYGDNVEPQLVRIRERLGRHRDQQKLESIIDALDSESSTVLAVTDSPSSSTKSSSSTKPTPTSDSAKPSKSGSGWDILNDLWPGEAEPKEKGGSGTEVQEATDTQPAEPKLTGAELREKLNNDLREWQNKFAVAADKGAEDLELRVAEITDRQIENGVKGHGAALTVQLEESANSSIEKIKNYIKQTVESIPEDATEQDLEAAYEQCIARTRELGFVVKQRAQAIREWKATYDQETDNLVRAAVASTVEILERIHNLGLQDVGMRWAWTDGVTVKDWKNYHKLRNTLTEWKEEVELVGARHDGLRVAHEEAKALEDKAMEIAQKMVTELVQLKDVSRWKIWAGDATDDFSEKKVPVRVFKAAKDAASGVENVASQASEAVVGSSTPSAESIQDAAASVVSSAEEKVGEASSAISEIIVGSETPSSESVVSKIQESASEASSQASETIVDTESTVTSDIAEASESVKSTVEEAAEEIPEKPDFASSEPKQQKVLGGVMAQAVVEAKEIILDQAFDDDDDETYSQKIQDLAAEAGDRAAELTRAVSEALLGTPTTQGSVESATSLASEQYAKALAAASSVLYGTEQQPLESATSVASEQFARAVTAASYAIYGTPTPTAVFQTIQIQASSRYDQVVSLANEQLSSAKSQLSVLASGTTKPAHETMLSLIEKAYSDSVAAASERLQVALQYTDSVKSYAAGPTQGYFESVSSVAASKLSEGISAASAQFTSKPTPALDNAHRQYYEAIGLAHARYSEFLEAASSGIYGLEQGTVESIASVASESVASAASQASSTIIGTETAWTESLASQASQNWEALIAKASTQVYGKPTPWHESAYSQASVYGAQATAQVTEQYAAVHALISELVVGKEPDFTESVMNRLSSAYYTGLPAVVESVNSYAGEGYDSATSYASEAYASASSVVSSVFSPPPAVETILSQASEQLELAVESASIAIYGTPKGNFEKASEAAASAYSSVQSKASEAVYGTQNAQDHFAGVAASAQAAISEAIWGTPTAADYVASVTSGAGSAYSSLSSAAGEQAANVASALSSAVYGPEQGAIESASSRLALAVEAANSKLSEIYADAAKSAEEAASTVSSVMADATQRVRDEL